MSSLETQIREAFPQRVTREQLTTYAGTATPHYGLFVDGQPMNVSAVTSSYVPHTVDDVVALAVAANDVFDGNSTVRCHWRNGQYLTVSPPESHRRTIYGTDTIWPRLIISAGYGGQAFRASLGFYRDACANLAMPRRVKGLGFSRPIRHTQSLNQHLEHLRSTFSAVASHWDGTVESIRRAEKRRINLIDFLNSVYGDPPTNPQNHSNRTESIVHRLIDERRKTGRPNLDITDAVTAWEAYNAVQGYEQHVTRRNKTNNGRWNRAILSWSSPHVLTAETIAFGQAS
jgi:hypothetical protein